MNGSNEKDEDEIQGLKRTRNDHFEGIAPDDDPKKRLDTTEFIEDRMQNLNDMMSFYADGYQSEKIIIITFHEIKNCSGAIGDMYQAVERTLIGCMEREDEENKLSLQLQENHSDLKVRIKTAVRNAQELR